MRIQKVPCVHLIRAVRNIVRSRSAANILPTFSVCGGCLSPESVDITLCLRHSCTYLVSFLSGMGLSQPPVSTHVTCFRGEIVIIQPVPLTNNRDSLTAKHSHWLSNWDLAQAGIIPFTCSNLVGCTCSPYAVSLNVLY